MTPAPDIDAPDLDAADALTGPDDPRRTTVPISGPDAREPADAADRAVRATFRSP